VKILYLITGLRLGGAEHQLLILAKNMLKEGYDVQVIAMESGGVMIGQFLEAGIVARELAIKKVGTLRLGYITFKKVVDDFKPDVIHSHMIHANLFARVFKLFNKKYKVINTAHNIQEGSNVMMKAYSLTRGLADWSTNVSREAYEYFVSKGYFDSKKSSYVPNAIDTAKFERGPVTSRQLHAELGIKPNTFLFFSAGRLEPQKNYRMLLKSFALVRKQVDNAYLVIAGEGREEAMLKELSGDLQINTYVRFLGRRSDMPFLLNESDCFVLSSSYEGFGMVVAEAMVAGTPVIATNCGGVEEVMGGHGELVKVEDTKAMAQAMIRAYRFPTSAAALEAARMHIEANYSIADVVSRWLQLYNAI
jgi:glycosyltransferase involved in cell wall biosynthesis